jgi:hypothetical protein
VSPEERGEEEILKAVIREHSQGVRDIRWGRRCGTCYHYSDGMCAWLVVVRSTGEVKVRTQSRQKAVRPSPHFGCFYHTTALLKPVDGCNCLDCEEKRGWVA